MPLGQLVELNLGDNSLSDTLDAFAGLRYTAVGYGGTELTGNRDVDIPRQIATHYSLPSSLPPSRIDDTKLISNSMKLTQNDRPLVKRRLRRLVLRNNQFWGPLAMLDGLASGSLEVLDLSGDANCGLGGPRPPEISRKWSAGGLNLNTTGTQVSSLLSLEKEEEESFSRTTSCLSRVSFFTCMSALFSRLSFLARVPFV